MAKSKQTFGGKVSFPVFFETSLYSTMLVSKYEAITIYLHQLAPKVMHQQRRNEYVSEYRLYQAKEYAREIPQNEFLSRYKTTLALCEEVVNYEKDFTEELTPVDYVSGQAIKTEIQGLDRQRYYGAVVIKHDGNNYAGSIDVVINRYGEIKYGNITFDDVQADFWDSRKVGVTGYIHTTKSPVHLMEQPIGASLPVNLNSKATALRVYQIGSAPVEGADFNNDFNSDFNI